MLKNKNTKLIIAIDSNAHHPAWGSPKEDSRGRALYKFIRDNDLIILNQGDEPTFISGDKQSHIDITIVSRNLKKLILGWKNIISDSFSDHKCLKTRISDSHRHKKTIPNYAKTPWSLFKANLEKHDWEFSLNPKEELNNAVNKLTTIIQDEVTNLTPSVIIPTRVRTAPWWSEEINSTRRELRVLFHSWVRNKSPTSRQVYVEKRNQFQKILRKSKRDYWINHANNIQSYGETSKYVKSITRKKTPPMGLTSKQDGTPTKNAHESLENLFSIHFPDLNNSVPRTVPASEDTNPISSNPHAWITIDNTSKFIMELTNSKAPGPDGIRNRTAKNLPNQVITILTEIFRKCIELEFIPDIWTESKAIFIPKPGYKDRTNPKAYRPICLANLFFKLLEKHIQYFLEINNIYPDKLSNRQHGFRHNRSTLTALSEVTSYIEEAFDQEEIVVAVCFDIKGAFDNLIIHNATNKLNSWGTPRDITNTLHSYYNRRTISTTNFDITITKHPSRGTGQGL